MSGSYTVKQPSAIRCKVEGINLTGFDINDFIELFLSDGPLNQYSQSIYGITTFNYTTKVFTLTFNLDTAAENIREFLNTFSNGKELTTSNGTVITLLAKRLPPPTDTITLYPMPHGVTYDTLTSITSGWGQLKSFDYGRHKLLPQIKNSYLHLKLSGVNSAIIPQRITVNQHYVAVLKPGDNITFRCGFCKLQGHKTSDCPEKQRPKVPSMKNQPGNTTRRGWQTYLNPNANSHLSTQDYPELNGPTNIIPESVNKAAQAVHFNIPLSESNDQNTTISEPYACSDIITPQHTSLATGKKSEAEK